MDQKRAPRHATSSKKIVAVHPATNGRQLANPSSPRSAPRCCWPRPPPAAVAPRSAAPPLFPRTRRSGRPAAAAAPPRCGIWAARSSRGPGVETGPDSCDACAIARSRRRRAPPPPPPPPQPTSPRRRDPPGRTVLEPPPRRRREVAREPIRLSARCRPLRPPPPQAPRGGGRCRRGPTRRRLRSSSSSQAAASNRGRSRTRRATACVAVAAQAVLAVARGKRKWPVKWGRARWRSSADEGEERGRHGEQGCGRH